MMTTIHEVYETVRDARAEGPDALAAMALSFGATMVLGVVRCRALRGQIAEMRAALEATEATVATLRAERDAAREALAAQDSAPDLDYPARAEVWKLREVVEALRDRAEKAEADRDRAVQEREAFSLRLSAAERERDEAREALDISRESAREAREEIAGALALVDEARARVEAIAVERNAIISELSQTTDAMMQARAERDAAIARSTYEARTVAPTRRELDRHKATRGRWLVTWQERHAPALRSDVVVGVWPPRTYPVGAVYLPLDASGLPCAWPVVP